MGFYKIILTGTQQTDHAPGHRPVIRLFLLLLLFPMLAGAQHFPSMDQRWGVSLSTGLVRTPLFRWTVQPGIEYRLSERFYLLTDFSLMNCHANKDSSAFERKFFRVQSELKYMLAHGSRRFHEYLALQASYSARKYYHADDGFFYNGKKESDEATLFSSAHVKSPVWTASAQYVFDIYAFKLFYIESFAGMGIRNINTTYSDIVDPQQGAPDRPSRREGLNIEAAEKFNASIYRFHLSAGVRLLYRFNNH